MITRTAQVLNVLEHRVDGASQLTPCGLKRPPSPVPHGVRWRDLVLLIVGLAAAASLGAQVKAARFFSFPPRHSPRVSPPIVRPT
eukprot:CAMPEP_0174732576 /NCGR_PEP_ID=MMETSP1094-20130205/59634_1 /TAXON_ID=156173 /ORGANISM="Chrysochromulina brevifilum, Strain UTEX LB 985" /LENGTH=84 /DNA_ID=CAMNT_0015935107 /DNA_START=373 /DNA_END=623 /DNA_ORIENTATION=+